MGKVRTLTGSDLKERPKTDSAARQRGAFPSSGLVPIQFKMTPEFVQAFKQEALNRRLKLNQLLEAIFAESKKA